MVPFFILGGGSGLMAYSILKARDRGEELGVEPSGETEGGLKKPENLLGTLSLDPISLKCGRNLVPLIDPSQNGPLLERITLVRYHIGQELGL